MFKLFSLPHEKKLSKTKQNIGSIDFLNPRIFESILWNVGHENEMIRILGINIHKKCIILTYVLKQFLRYGWSVREYANIHVILFLLSDWGLNRSTNVIGSVKICYAVPNFANNALRQFILFLNLAIGMILSVNNHWINYSFKYVTPRPIICTNMTWINYLPFRTCSLSLWCMARLHWSLNGCLLRYCSRSEKQRVS